jgi:hypothetical protein
MRAWCVYLLLASAAFAGDPAKIDRWQNYSRDAFLSPGAFFANVLPAVGDQQANRPVEFGQGWDAFGDRVGRRALQYQVQSGLYHASAAALRTQTSYSSCKCEGAWKRFGYAFSRTFVTRTDGGRLVPNAPLVGGFLGGGVIAMAWQPASYRATDGLRLAGFQLGGRTTFNILREFSPELKRLFRLR